MVIDNSSFPYSQQLSWSSHGFRLGFHLPIPGQAGVDEHIDTLAKNTLAGISTCFTSQVRVMYKIEPELDGLMRDTESADHDFISFAGRQRFLWVWTREHLCYRQRVR